MKTIRRKGKWKSGEAKYVIEENRKYLETLPPANELYELLRLAKKQSKASQIQSQTKEKQPVKFGHSLLTESLEDRKNKTQRKATEQELKILWEITR